MPRFNFQWPCAGLQSAELSVHCFLALCSLFSHHDSIHFSCSDPAKIFVGLIVGNM